MEPKNTEKNKKVKLFFSSKLLNMTENSKSSKKDSQK